MSFTDYTATEEIIRDAYGKMSTLTFNEPLSSDDHPSTIYPKAWANIKGDCYAQSKSLIKSLKLRMRSNAQDF